MPSKYEIFDCWKDKIITDDFRVAIVDKEKPAGLKIIEDWAFPECWACGEPPLFAQDEATLKKQWNNSHNLQRAHIVAKQFGGSNQADNLFLLCPICHAEAPDTRHAEDFFAWVAYSRKHVHYFSRFQGYLKQAAMMKGLNFEELIEKCSGISFDIESLRSEARREMGMHGNMINGLTMGFTWIHIFQKHGFF